MYVAEVAVRLDSMSRVKLGGFRSKIKVSCVSSHTEELWYNESLSEADNENYLKSV